MNTGERISRPLPSEDTEMKKKVFDVTARLTALLLTCILCLGSIFTVYAEESAEPEAALVEAGEEAADFTEEVSGQALESETNAEGSEDGDPEELPEAEPAETDAAQTEDTSPEEPAEPEDTAEQEEPAEPEDTPEQEEAAAAPEEESLPEEEDPAVLEAMASEKAINKTTFPDSTLRNYVLTEIDTNGNGKLSASEIEVVDFLDVSDTSCTSLTAAGVP